MAKCDSHQDLEEDHEQLVTGHEVTVEDSQIEPASQTPKHLDKHLLVVPCLLHTRCLKTKIHQKQGDDAIAAVSDTIDQISVNISD